MNDEKKILVAGDIHGRVNACFSLLEKIKEQKPDEIWLMGDLMYNGPRNGVPDDYEPMEVADMLSSIAVPVFGIRGNCDSRVDEMLLPFGLEDYRELVEFGRKFALYHGDLGEPKDYDVLVYGHTHLPVAEQRGGKFVLNPGSAGFPKGGYPASYAVVSPKGMEVLSLLDDSPIKAVSF